MPPPQTLLACLLSALAWGVVPAQEPVKARRLVWQPVQQYFIRKQGEAQPPEGTRRLNSFTSYTHLGSDFGFHGPAEHEIEWVDDKVTVHLGQQPDAWAGIWHSLAGQARNASQVLDFTRAHPLEIHDAYQPRITQIMLDAGGRGNLKLEIKNAAGATVWERLLSYYDESAHLHAHPLASEQFRDAKLVVWTAEPGSEVTVRGVYLGVEVPRLPWDAHAFVTSYAKLLRCHDLGSGLTRDRAHLEDGSFESLAATGLFALSTAAAAQEPLGVVSTDFARRMLRHTHAATRRLTRVRGLLPHFVSKRGDAYQIHPGTEYSTVDTALYYQCMLLAARMLGEESVAAETLNLIREVDVDSLRLPSGHLSHGLNSTGKDVLPHGWRDWGGETALVMLLQRMARPGCPIPPSDHPGHAWQGTGFITEIQSLLHPDFASDVEDRIDGVQWLAARRIMLGAQQSYFTHALPGCLVSRLGIYGLSAGENQYGNAYQVGGVDLRGQDLIHPHYMLMSAALADDTAPMLQRLERLEKAGFFPPWGLVENLTPDGSSLLPMNGALNAGFEALGAYHLLAKHRHLPDRVHEASLQCAEIRDAMGSLFSPPSKSPGE